jgi:hypothetical protein
VPILALELGMHGLIIRYSKMDVHVLQYAFTYIGSVREMVALMEETNTDAIDTERGMH